MKRLPSLRDVYKGIRKPVAPPTRVERDRRDDIKSREARKGMDGYRGRGGRRGGSGKD
jgi:hypothetical protein